MRMLLLPSGIDPCGCFPRATLQLPRKQKPLPRKQISLPPGSSAVAFPAGVTVLLLPGLERLFKEEFFIILYYWQNLYQQPVYMPLHRGCQHWAQSPPLVRCVAAEAFLVLGEIELGYLKTNVL